MFTSYFTKALSIRSHKHLLVCLAQLITSDLVTILVLKQVLGKEYTMLQMILATATQVRNMKAKRQEKKNNNKKTVFSISIHICSYNKKHCFMVPQQVTLYLVTFKYLPLHSSVRACHHLVDYVGIIHQTSPQWPTSSVPEQISRWSLQNQVRAPVPI